MRTTLILAALIVVSSSCSPPSMPSDAGEPIEPMPELDAGFVPLDAGLPELDAGPPDAGSVDSGFDAGAVDAGSDAGTPDAGLPDAGTPDAGTPDAGCSCALPQFCNAQNVCALDSTPPQLSVTVTAGSNAGLVRVRGTAVDSETGISSVDVRVNQGPAVTATVTNGNFDVEVAATGTEFTADVSGRDRANNLATAQATFDPTSPVIALTPADAMCGALGCTGAIINAATPSVTVTASVTEFALATLDPVRITVRTAAGTVLVPATVMLRQGSTFTWSWTNFPSLDDTLIDFVVTATDAAGNVGTATVHGRIDRQAPALAIAAPSQDASCNAMGCTGGVINTSTTNFAINGSSDAAQLSVRVRDGAAVIVPATDVTLSSGLWSWSWTTPPGVDGRYFSAELIATDVLGNATTRSVVVLVDRVLPSLVITAPMTNALVGTATVAIAANAADGLGVRVVEAATSPTGPFTAATLDTSGDFVASLPVPVVDAVNQDLTIRVTDLAGNTRSLTRRYVADRVAPVVTVNGADFDCSGMQCTGMVANRASTSVAFSGTATDGSAISLQKTIVGGAPVTSSTDPVTGGAWSWSWSSLPANVNGAAYELRLIATDAAGNASAQVVRRVWLDNVAPTAIVPVAGQRNVSRTATLLTFSEPMDVGSVLTATSFLPSAMLTGFGSTDRVNFRYASPILANYTYYHLVSSSPRDLAGNVLAVMADAYFLSEPVARNATTVARAAFPGFTYRYPVLAVDSDQQLFVNYTAINGSTVTTEVLVLAGTGQQASLANAWSGFGFAREGEMRIVSETRGADQRLNPTIEHTLSLSNGSSGFVSYGSQTHTWSGAAPMPSFVTVSSVAANNPTLATIDQFRPTIDLRPYSNGIHRGLFAPNVGATAMTAYEQDGAVWTSQSPAALTTFRRMDGRASVEATATLGQFRIRYYDFSAMSEVGTAGFVRAATGQPALKRLDTFFGAPVANSGSFMAWASDTQLTILCSPAPFSPGPVWRPTALAMPATTTGTGLTSAMNNTRVVFAAEFGGNVYVHSTPVTACGASPVVTQLAVLNGMRDPNVFLDAAGAVWVAAISTAGDVVVHKL